MYLVDNESELSSTQLEILGEISKKVNNIVSQVAGEHKDLHGALSKIGKSIDRVSEIMQAHRVFHHLNSQSSTNKNLTQTTSSVPIIKVVKYPTVLCVLNCTFSTGNI